jgi:RNA polymerase subunit RPABC4/transcription elongation factor Spt4
MSEMLCPHCHEFVKSDLLECPNCHEFLHWDVFE